MVQDFGKAYNSIHHFSGLWDFGHDDFGKRDAMAVLAEAVRQCVEDDQRQRQEVKDALAYLERQSGCTGRLRAFRKALDTEHPTDRQNAARAAYVALAASMGQSGLTK